MCGWRKLGLNFIFLLFIFYDNDLQAMVSSLEKKIDEAEKKCEETRRISEERLKQATEAESKITILHESMQRCACNSLL